MAELSTRSIDAATARSSSGSEELRQHEDTFNRLVRSLLTDVAIMKLGVTSSRANDLLHKLKHLEELRRTRHPAQAREAAESWVWKDGLPQPIGVAQEAPEPIRAALEACHEYFEKRSSIRWSDPLRAQIRDALAFPSTNQSAPVFFAPPSEERLPSGDAAGAGAGTAISSTKREAD